MATPEFAHGLAQLVDMASARRTAVMCSEFLWWRCHRRLIADLLAHRGWRVLHIVDGTRRRRIRRTPTPGPPDCI